MPEIRIESVDDPRISVYRDLPKRNLASGSGRFIAEGQHLLARVLASDFEIESVLASDAHLSEVRRLITGNVPLFVASKRLLREIVGFRFHRGVLACGLRRPYPPLGAVVPPPSEPATLVLLSQVQDPENVGAILRAGAAFGVDGVVFGPHCADPFSRRVLRVSMGAVWKLPLATSDDLARDVRWLQQQAEIEVAATVLDAQAEPLAGARRHRRMALLFGSEGHGLDPSLIGQCRRRLTIPMRPGTDSLNAAMAAGIFLYYVTQICLPERPEKE
jgi:tRNA G18 (ribose-2'-O)-methylase SpoU